MTWKRIENGSVTSPLGFLASGMHAGIKANQRKYDCSLILSEVPAVSAGVFTINKAKAWPLQYDQKIINRKTHRAILANSGNANCFNGASGRKTVRISADLISKKLKIKKSEVFLSSTGIIGKPFPLEKLETAIPVLASSLSRDGGLDAARGILTTDTTAKSIAVRFNIGGKQVTLGGMAKGAGMIYPEMTLTGERHAERHATMLCFLTTDLAITKPMLKQALAHASGKTFNRIAIDNDMSTNDMAIILANGMAENEVVDKEGKAFETFQKALTDVCAWIAKELVKDGEGVRHVCNICVKGAKNSQEALRAAKQIATSMLVKTMLAGEDPNWGRVVAAVGSTGVEFSNSLDVSFDGVTILKNGVNLHHKRSEVRQVLKKKEFTLEVDLKKGSAEESFLTTDLTKFYVWINSSYSS